MGNDQSTAIHTGMNREDEKQKKDVDAEVENNTDYDWETDQHVRTDKDSHEKDYDVDAEKSKHSKKAYDVDKLKFDIDTGKNEEMDDEMDGDTGGNSGVIDDELVNADKGPRSTDTRSLYRTISKETKTYEYAILISGGSIAMLTKYKVFRKNGEIPEAAHVVEFQTFSNRANQPIKVYGYSIFVGQADTGFGPVKSATAPCMIMVEQSPKTLHLSISNPSIAFKYDPKYKPKPTCTL